jgi:hypothetical protein
VTARTSFPPATCAGAYGIHHGPETDWFNPALNRETDLFVDPFLVFDDQDPLWAGAEDAVLRFFNEALLVVAESRHASAIGRRHQAESMFSFPEPDSV